MGLSTVQAVSAVVALVVPILVAFLASRFVLTKLAADLGRYQNRAADSTMFYALRTPLKLAGVVVGVSMCSMVVRGAGLPSLRGFDWAIFDQWVRSALTLLGFYAVYRVSLFGVRVAASHTDSASALLLRRMLGAVLCVIAAITVLNQFEVKIGPILASLGVAGLAAALALQDTLGNYFSGILLTLDKPFRPGDYVILKSGMEGYVDMIGWRTTHIRTLSNTIVVVPNSKLAGSRLVNTSYPNSSVQTSLRVGVAYESDLDHVEAIAIQTASKVQTTVQGADPDFTPYVRFQEFGDSNVLLSVFVQTLDYPSTFRIRHELLKALFKRFGEEKISMSYPVRRVVGLPPAPEEEAGRLSSPE